MHWTIDNKTYHGKIFLKLPTCKCTVENTTENFLDADICWCLCIKVVKRDEKVSRQKIGDVM